MRDASEMQDAIEREITLDAPPSRVWRALSDHEQFGAWFRVKTDRPFAPGAKVGCRCTYEGLEHLTWTMTITAMEPGRRLVWEWDAYYGEDGPAPGPDDVLTVEFTLAPEGSGTRLTIVERGFSSLPADYAPTAFRLNSGGWDEQAKNIKAHVER
jgi:uncharacterized protein YndB with AHSA1/START domain